MALRINWSHFSSYTIAILTLLASWLLVFMIYQCKDWARWIYATLTAFGLLVLTANFSRAAGVTSLLVILYSALGLTAAIMLFTPSSNDWFKSHGKSA
jgi:uncharacterized membrane protein YhhN